MTDEPERIGWTTKAGLPAVVARSATPVEALCGYVGVPEGHPLFGLPHTDNRVGDVPTHGGVSFAGDHPGAGRLEPLVEEAWAALDGTYWWIGFDAGHGFDMAEPRGKRPYGETHLGDRLAGLRSRRKFSHTVLPCEKGTNLPYDVRDLADKYGERAPRDLRTWVGSSGERYGKTNTTASGDMLLVLRVKYLLRLARRKSVRRYVQHRAAWAYLAALPPDSRSACRAPSC